MPNIEELMRKAMKEGKFDNLPGKGKPIHLEDANPHADPDWDLAYGILKDGGYSLPWIETRREIEADIESARKDLSLAWDVYRDGYAQDLPSSYWSESWERSQLSFRDLLTAINKRIRDYNLQVPIPRFQRPVLDYDIEVQRIKDSIS